MLFVTIVLDYLKLAVSEVAYIFSGIVLFQVQFDVTITKYPKMYNTIENTVTTRGFPGSGSHTGPGCFYIYMTIRILNISEIHNIYNILKPVPSYKRE